MAAATSPPEQDAAGSTLSRRAGAAATFTLAAIAFIVVTGETTPVGLLSDVARGVHATESQVGVTVGGYALVAAATAVPLTRWSSRLDRRQVVVAGAVVFAAGHVVAALATHIAVLMAGRGIAALGHGVYFAVAAPAAIRLARDEMKGRAGSRVMVGAATALVIGTPLTTFIGQAAGWRTAMLTVAAVSLALAVTARRLLPPLPGSSRDRRQPAPGIAATLRLPGLTIVLTVTLAVVTGHFALYTYMAPYAAEQLDVLGAAFTVVLLAYGTAAVAGSVLGGRLADLGPVTGTRAAATTFVAALLGLWLAGRAGAPVVGVPLMLLWGGTFSVLAVSTALAALRRAPGAHAETANAVYGIVFQIGILAGSALGATGVAAGLLAGVPLVAATCGLVMLALALHGGRAFRGDPPTGPGPHATPHPTR